MSEEATELRVTKSAPAKFREWDRDRVLDAVGLEGGVLFLHAKARILRILEGSGEGHATTIEGGLKDAQMPKLAREFADLLVNYKFRFREHKHNPFIGLSEVDASRKLLACIYSICDRSTGRLGPWRGHK